MTAIMLCVSPRACSTLYENMSCISGRRVVSILKPRHGGNELRHAYIRPRDVGVGRFLKRADDRVAHDLVREVYPRRVLDEGEARLASACVPPERDVLLERRDVLLGPIFCLLGDRAEE